MASIAPTTATRTAPVPAPVTAPVIAPVTAAKRAAVLAFAQLVMRAMAAMAEAPATDDVKVQTGQTLRG